MSMGRRTKKIRAMAVDLLKQGDMKAPDQIDMNELAKRLDVTLEFKPLGEISGALLRKNNRIIIGVNNDHHRNRQRFTIAHEIGHLLLHSNNSLYVDKIFPVKLRDQSSSEAVDIDEIEANAFAAELLMPLFMLENEPELKRQVIDYEYENIIASLAERYKVSTQAMTFRLINLGLISN